LTHIINDPIIREFLGVKRENESRATVEAFSSEVDTGFTRRKTRQTSKPEFGSDGISAGKDLAGPCTRLCDLMSQDSAAYLWPGEEPRKKGSDHSTTAGRHFAKWKILRAR